MRPRVRTHSEDSLLDHICSSASGEGVHGGNRLRESVRRLLPLYEACAGWPVAAFLGAAAGAAFFGAAAESFFMLAGWGDCLADELSNEGLNVLVMGDVGGCTQKLLQLGVTRGGRWGGTLYSAH
jgi:hypothetical protein